MTDPADYVRQIETYLCQKNGGHLIRVVGPAFELVRGWVEHGVPLKVAFHGIDRCCKRQERKGPRRRPIRIEFCEADVLDAFDAWRRAVGVAVAAGADGVGDTRPRKPPLVAHIERAIARLAHTRGTGAPSSDLHHHIDLIVRELEDVSAAATRARGEARAVIIARLSELDASLIDAAAKQLDPERARQLRKEAAEELAPFGARMAADVRSRALEAAFRRLVRETTGLPTLGYE